MPDSRAGAGGWYDDIVAVAATIAGCSAVAIRLDGPAGPTVLAEVGLREGAAELDRLTGPAARASHDAGRDEPAEPGAPGAPGAPGVGSLVVPLPGADGGPAGTLCLLDARPGRLSEEQRATLRRLADLAARLVERDRHEEHASESCRELTVVFDGIPAGLVLTDGAGVVQRVNRAFLDLVGGDGADYVGRLWPDVVPADDRVAETTLITDLRDARQTSVVRELTLPRRTGAPAPVLASSSVAREADGSVGSVVTRIEDIALIRQAEIELRESQSVLDAIITVDARERIVSWNIGAQRLFGYPRGAALGTRFSRIVPDHPYRAVVTRPPGEGAVEVPSIHRPVELEAVTADDTRLPVELSMSRWLRGREPFYTAVIRDISERRRHEAEVERRSTHDPATGLPTMRALGQWFDERCADLPDGRFRAVFCLQLTNLSTVSSALGIEASRSLLRLIGAAFAAVDRDDLAVAHLRDTHFGGAAVLAANVDPASVRERLGEIARQVVAAGSGPYAVGGLRIEMQVQFGVVSTASGRVSFLELLRQAEATRDSSARHVNIGPERVTAGDPTGMRDLLTLSDLQDAVAQDQLELHYQPLTPLQPVRVTRDRAAPSAAPQVVEALLRWRHPERGLVPPGAFVPLIESSRLMYDVTTWVLQAALAQQTRWRAAGLDVRVAVNVSPQMLLDHDVVELVSRALTDTGAAADRLKVEITESAIVDDPERAREIVADLRDLGVHVSLDDFGTGYTSLRLLRDLAVDEIKLDRLFVANATANPADAAIANVVGQLGQRLGVRTVAEGVEDVETRSLFRAFGYDYMQGYLDSRPLPADRIDDWLRAHPSVDPVG